MIGLVPGLNTFSELVDRFNQSFSWLLGTTADFEDLRETPLKFADYPAFKTGGFSAACGSKRMLDKAAARVYSIGAKKTTTNALMIFDDKDYISEFPISIWSYDFAWEHKKRLVEIDGEQHERYDDYKERDNRKDRYARELGYDILRIRWKDMYSDTRKWINIAKEFINSDVI